MYDLRKGDDAKVWEMPLGAFFSRECTKIGWKRSHKDECEERKIKKASSGKWAALGEM